MSLLKYRDIRTFFTIFLLASILCLPTVLGGICWSKMSKKGYCKEILKPNISQENCCSETNSDTAYSTEDLSGGQLFFWRTLADGVPCKPCKETCENMQCGQDKKCVIKMGRPTCVCAPKCKHQKNKKGPVCGTDGRTYKSVCRMKKRACRTKDQSLNINYYGICQNSCQKVKCPEGKYCIQDQNLNAHCVKCHFYCSSHHSSSNSRRVCGSDGRTYPNACHLRKMACLNSRTVSIAYEGRCKSNASCENIRCPRGEKCLISKSSNLPRCISCSECPKWKSAATIRRETGGPICASNNQTYDAWCFMIEDSCRKGYLLETQFAGSCQTGNRSLELLDNSVMSKYG